VSEFVVPPFPVFHYLALMDFIVLSLLSSILLLPFLSSFFKLAISVLEDGDTIYPSLDPPAVASA
jgi:hypothetical protein